MKTKQTKLWKMTIRKKLESITDVDGLVDKSKRSPERMVYVAGDTMIEATSKLLDEELHIEEELLHVTHVSDECYV